jgi:RNA polymerase sigma-70 factor (ECF subfamily)
LSDPSLDPRFFRHEYGRLVSVLSRRVGLQHLEAVEDAAQAALLAALEAWPKTAVPEAPSAWLYRAAYNKLVEELRRQRRRDRLLDERVRHSIDAPTPEPTTFLGGDVRDDLLRMLFVCCDDAIPVESQLVLALKTLCGFEVREIADRLFLGEANVYKRLARGRARLREGPWPGDDLEGAQLASRLPAVQAVLYLLFTEGHLSSHAELAIRRELCEEAMRLAGLLADHPVGRNPETFALLAMMHLHVARMGARQDGSGGLLLLEEQDRTLWDQAQIRVGLEWLAKSARGDVFSRYHAEAGIAAEHCLAPSLADTRWDRIVECYDLLERSAPSSVHALNRALALAEWRGPEAGLTVLEGLEPPSWLSGSYSWAAVLADLHGRCGHSEAARRYRDVAVASAPTPAVRALLERRLRRHPA